MTQPATQITWRGMVSWFVSDVVEGTWKEAAMFFGMTGSPATTHFLKGNLIKQISSANH
jgi:hypothetical protein